MSNTWGHRIKLSIFGESHGEAIGLIFDGLPPGLFIDWALVEKEMARRAPGYSILSTPRKERDRFQIVSGWFDNKTTGTPLGMMIKNENTKPSDYAPHLLRPGHADLAALYKYRGHADYRGGGHFSGRLTAPLVFAGAIAKQILAQNHVFIGARIARIHTISDSLMNNIEDIIQVSQKQFPVFNDLAGEEMQQAIIKAKDEGDSVGGIIECAALGVPGGWGNPFFHSLESAISSLIFSIPAVKGIEFGDGFALAGMKGSEANDQFFIQDNVINTKTNHNGGINGGISNGQPIIFRVIVKPTPTIRKEQSTVDMQKKETVTTSFGGRHDPCIVPRALPVIEAGMALCLLDSMENYNNEVR